MTGLRGSRSVSGNSELFEDLPEQAVPGGPGRGTPRLRQPERHQPGWQIVAIDDLVARDHPVRAVWAFVQGLDDPSSSRPGPASRRWRCWRSIAWTSATGLL